MVKKLILQPVTMKWYRSDSNAKLFVIGDTYGFAAIA